MIFIRIREKMFHLLIIVLLMGGILVSCTSEKIRIGIIAPNATGWQNEADSIKTLLMQMDEKYEPHFVKVKSILSDKKLLDEIDVVWYHRRDTSAVTAEEQKMGKVLAGFVANGGGLMLSMDAVRLLNEWQLEKTPVEVAYRELKDEGFGRKIGFHSYRSHPVFDRLHGGAYIWHGKSDNKARTLGFMEEHIPQADGAGVIGVDWAYITYHKQRKLIWEMPYGKGKILAVGAYMYFAEHNFHKKELACFTDNCLGYLGGKSSESKVRHWDYGQVGIQKRTEKVDALKTPGAHTWQFPDKELSITRTATENYYDIPGRRVVVQGKEYGGIDEIWAHPFMSLRDFEVKVKINRNNTIEEIGLNGLKPKVTISGESIFRNYELPNGTQLSELIFTSPEKPVAAVHYQWEGDLSQIILSYKSNLRYMWPYDTDALGSLYYDYSDDANCFIVTDKDREFCSLVGYSQKPIGKTIGRYDEFQFEQGNWSGVETDKLQIAGMFVFDTRAQQALDVCFVAGNEGAQKVKEQYISASANLEEIYANTLKSWDDYLNGHLSVISPDSSFNKGLRWAMLGAAQFLVETPGVGTSLMAGYSTTARGWNGFQKVSGRPGYAWYFGRDAQWSGLAVNDYGDFEMVKQILETFIKYQKVDGKIYHELTSSGSVHYDASDATPLFVILAADYLRHSGNLVFLKENWNAIKKAMDYCYSTDTDNDGFIEISNVGHGWLEGGALYGSDTELYLVGIWARALKDAGYMAALLNDQVAAQKYNVDGKSVMYKIEEKFWNKKGYYNYGMYRDGSVTDPFIILTSVPAYFDVLDRSKTAQMVEDYAGNEFSSDWGTRMIGESNPLYNPGSYHFGSVWPLFTGWTALAEYEHGRYNQGFTRIMANLLNYRYFSPGRVVEVMNGKNYKPSGVTTHQCWSETMVIQPSVEGMLGYSPDAMENRVELSPRLPFDWNKFSVEHLKFAQTDFGFNMEKNSGKMIWEFSSNNTFTMKFSPVLPLDTRVKNVVINGETVPFVVDVKREYCILMLDEFEVQPETLVEIWYDGGISVLPEYEIPEEGAPSQGVRVLNQEVANGVLKIKVEGLAGKSYQINLISEYEITGVKGGDILPVSGLESSVLTLQFTLNEGSDKYIIKTIEVSYK